MTPSHDLTRRDFLRASAWSALAVGLAACGPSATEKPSAPAPPASASAPPATATPEPSAPASASASPALSLEAKIARLLVVGFRGLDLESASSVGAAISDQGLGGVILFDRDQATGGPRNIASPEQLTALVSGLKGLAIGRNLLVAVDQEGGKVVRLKPAYGFPAATSEAAIGATDSEAAATAWAESIAGTLASVGINFNLAPVVDLNVNPTNPAIGALDRSFSADPEVVVRMARAEIDAHRAAGVRTTMKHFPGLGSASTNTDFGVADVTKTWSRTELEPFRSLIDAGAADSVMAGNLVNGQIDPEAPASLSKATVTDLLRGELGWDGVVITDDLQAAAITEAFGRDEAIARAVEAGNDLLLFANQQTYDADIVDRVVTTIAGFVTSGRISEARIDESFARVEAFATTG